MKSIRCIVVLTTAASLLAITYFLLNLARSLS